MNAAARNALRSCTTCSKAKAKCVRQPGQANCERCARLRKDCHSREPTMRRKKQIKTTRAAQLEKLENKIEHLVNALSIAQTQREQGTIPNEPSPPSSEGSFREGHRQSDVVAALCYEESEDDLGNCPGSTASTGTTPATFSSSHITSPSANHAKPPVTDYHALGVSMPEAEVLLDRFRRLMAPYFPFVLIPDSATVTSLHAEKPLLLHAIVQVASFQNLLKQQSMMKQFMRDVSERVLINCEKSLDTVQALLLVCAWYQPYLFVMRQVTNLLQLASALVLDLGLDRPPLDCVGDFRSTSVRAVNGSLPTRPSARDEFRVLAGLYYITSMVSSSFRKMDPIPYSKYLQEALDHLDKTQEHDSDRLLVQLVRSQHLLQDASTVDTEAPMLMYIRAFNADLAKMRRSDPTQESDLLLRLQHQVAEISILELSLNELQEHRAASAPLRTHLEGLWRLVEAAKDYMSDFCTIPLATYHLLPFSVLGQFAHTFILLTKIASLEIDGLDNRALQDQISFLPLVDTIIARFEQTASVRVDDFHVSNPSFANWATRARWMKSMYEARFCPKPAATMAPPSRLAITAAGPTPPSSRASTQPALTPQDVPSSVVSPDASFDHCSDHCGSAATTAPVDTWTMEQSTTSYGRAHGSSGPVAAQQLPSGQIYPTQQAQLQSQSQGQGPGQPFSASMTTNGLPLQSAGGDDFMSGDFFQYLDENFWQSFAGDLNMPDVPMA